MAVKVSGSIPAGATAVGEFAYSDRLGHDTGGPQAGCGRAWDSPASRGSTLVLNDGDDVRVVLGLGASGDVGADGGAVAPWLRSPGPCRNTARWRSSCPSWISTATEVAAIAAESASAGQLRVHRSEVR